MEVQLSLANIVLFCYIEGPDLWKQICILIEFHLRSNLWKLATTTAWIMFPIRDFNEVNLLEVLSETIICKHQTEFELYRRNIFTWNSIETTYWISRERDVMLKIQLIKFKCFVICNRLKYLKCSYYFLLKVE